MWVLWIIFSNLEFKSIFICNTLSRWSDSWGYMYEFLVNPPLITRFWPVHSNLLRLLCDLSDSCPGVYILYSCIISKLLSEHIHDPGKCILSSIIARHAETLHCTYFNANILSGWSLTENETVDWVFSTTIVLFLISGSVQIIRVIYLYISGHQQTFYVNVLRNFNAMHIRFKILIQ